jgi:hypothetical protein
VLLSLQRSKCLNRFERTTYGEHVVLDWAWIVGTPECPEHRYSVALPGE